MPSGSGGPRQGHALQYTWQNEGFGSAWVPQGCGTVRSDFEEACVADPRRIQVVGREDVADRTLLCPSVWRGPSPVSLSGDLVVWSEVSQGIADIVAVMMMVLLIVMPWRLWQLLQTLRRGVPYQHPTLDLEVSATPLLQAGSGQLASASWRQEVLWHVVAAFSDLLCLLACLILTVTGRLPSACRAVRANGGYFRRNAHGRALLEPQMVLLAELKRLLFERM